MFKRRLVFKPHPYVPGMIVAKANGYSVINGPYINGFEVMYPEGDVSSGHTLHQAGEIVFGNQHLTRRS